MEACEEMAVVERLTRLVATNLNDGLMPMQGSFCCQLSLSASIKFARKDSGDSGAAEPDARLGQLFDLEISMATRMLGCDNSVL